MNVNNIYKWLFGLLTTTDSSMSGSDISAMTATASRAERRELLLIARKEECLPNLYQEWEAAGLLSSVESADHDLLKRRQSSAAEVLDRLPAGVVLVTGASMQRYYPPRTPRFSTEIDLLVPDFNTVGAVHEAVRPLGYRQLGAGRCYVPVRGPLHKGFATYRYWSANAYENAPSIQVHVAGLPIDAQRNLPGSELVEKAAALEGHACLRLEPTRQLLLFIADCCSRSAPITVRHLADVHHLLRVRGGAIDYAYLQRRVEEWALWNGLAKLQAAIVDKRLTPVVEWGKLGELMNTAVARIARQAERAKRPAAARKSGGPSPFAARAAAWIVGAFELFGEQRDDDWAARIARSPMLVSLVLDAGHRVRAVPLSSKGAAAPQLMNIDGSLYLANGAGLFLLSLVDLSKASRADLFNRSKNGKSVVLTRWSGAARSKTASR